MKYLLSLLFPIVFLVSCQKEESHFEIVHKPVSFFPNMNQTDTRAADDYVLSDYFNVCSTVTVRMMTGNEVKTAVYEYNAGTKKLEYAKGTPLYYPENNSSYQLIISWPDEETYTQLGKADYRHQENENSFIRCDRLSDTINNAVEVEYLPIYFTHLKSKLTLIPILSGWDTTEDTVDHLTVNGYKPFHHTTHPGAYSYQLIYDPSIEAETTDINNNQVTVWLATNRNTESEFHFRFDASGLKAGENREIKMFIPPFLYELKK